MRSLIAHRPPSIRAFNASNYRSIARPCARRHTSHIPSAHKPNAFRLNCPAHRSKPGPATLRMVMFGKPGAGKGTLSARLVRKYDVTTLSAGDLLRRRVSQGAEGLGAAEGSMNKGELLPDEVVLKFVSDELCSLKDKHWTLDGFPRTLRQGELLDTQLKAQGTPLSLIINLDVPDQVILSRIADRWTHLPSGRVYNLNYNRPKVPGIDDITGEKLVQRPDDNPQTFARRLEQFYKSTSPLLSYYSSNSRSALLVTLRGNTSDEIWPQLEAAVKRAFPGIRERAESRRKARIGEAILAEEDMANTGTSASVIERDKL